MGRYNQVGFDTGPILADRVEVDVSMFSGNLSSLDDDVQKALETLDALSLTESIAFNDLSDMPGGDISVGAVTATSGKFGTDAGESYDTGALIVAEGSYLRIGGMVYPTTSEIRFGDGNYVRLYENADDELTVTSANDLHLETNVDLWLTAGNSVLLGATLAGGGNDITNVGEITTGILNTDDWDAADGTTNLITYNGTTTLTLGGTQSYVSLLASGTNATDFLEIGNSNAGVFRMMGDGSDSVMAAVFNNLIYEWQRSSDTDTSHTILFRGHDNTSGTDEYHNYFEAGGITDHSVNGDTRYVTVYVPLQVDVITDEGGTNTLFSWDSGNSEIDIGQDINLGIKSITGTGSITVGSVTGELGVYSDYFLSQTGTNNLFTWDSVNSELDLGQNINLSSKDLIGNGIVIKTDTAGEVRFEGTESYGSSGTTDWGIKLILDNNYFPRIGGYDTDDDSSKILSFTSVIGLSRDEGIQVDNDNSAWILSPGQSGGADRLALSVQSSGNTGNCTWVLIADTTYDELDYIGAQNDPALLIAANENDATSYGMFQHDRTNFNISSGKGNVELIPAEYVVLNSSKATTGDPTGKEGMIYINTNDNAVKMYADGAWRTLASW